MRVQEYTAIKAFETTYSFTLAIYSSEAYLRNLLFGFES